MQSTGIAYLVSTLGGYVITATVLYVISCTIGTKRKFSKWLDFWLGTTERAVATTLVIWAPSLIAGFVGGWVTLKFAANWQRQPDDDARQRGLLFLIGNVISFSVAVGAGIFVHPESLSTWSNLIGGAAATGGGK